MNIFKELEDDLGIKNYEHGDLSSWAKQGVLLMNTSLTVEKGKPGSHLKFGWEQLTDQVIRSFNKRKKIVFMLWGKFAVKKKKLIDEDKQQRREDGLLAFQVHQGPSMKVYFRNIVLK